MNSNNNYNQPTGTALTPAFINKIAAMCYGSYYINNVGEDAFYKHVPAVLSPIYKQAVLWHQWSSSGFVPTFHESNNGIIQTNIGVCKAQFRRTSSKYQLPNACTIWFMK